MADCSPRCWPEQQCVFGACGLAGGTDVRQTLPDRACGLEADKAQLAFWAVCAAVSL